MATAAVHGEGEERMGVREPGGDVVIRRTLVVVDLMSPLDGSCSTAARIRSRCLKAFFVAARGSTRQRRARLPHRS